ncbi:MAG: secretin N-terminal domain-containing protein [Candidatus Omnitrophota bacterium]
MKNKKILFMIVLFCAIFFSLRPGILQSQEFFFDPTAKITMDFKDANIKDVLKVFSVQSGANFIASSALQDRILTLYLNNVAIEDAINQIFKANNLSYEFVSDSNIYIVKDMGGPTLETITRVYKLKFARVENSWITSDVDERLKADQFDEGATSSATSSSSSSSTNEQEKEEFGITKVIKRILTENGKVIEDRRTNSLIITDVPMNFSRIESVLAQLDVPTPQVLIEVEMLDVSKATSDAIGVNWSGIWMNLAGAGPMSTRFPFDHHSMESRTGVVAGAVAGNLFKTFTMGTLSATALTAVLDFIETKTDTKYLARPRILCMNNEVAEIKITTDESVGVTTGSLTQQSGAGAVTQITAPERVQTGVMLRVAPQINIETGDVTMYVEPIVRDAAAGTQINAGGAGNFTFRDPSERTTKSTLRVKDGETIVIGGLLRDRKAERVQGIPWLSKIPILGQFLFSQKYTGNTNYGTQTGPGVNDQRELLVFITPHIVKDESMMQLASSKAAGSDFPQPQMPITIPVREQAPLTTRQKAINETLKNFE